MCHTFQSTIISTPPVHFPVALYSNLMPHIHSQQFKCSKRLVSFYLPSHVVVPDDDNDDKDIGSSSQD
jgi:hypothetical protein